MLGFLGPRWSSAPASRMHLQTMMVNFPFQASCSVLHFFRVGENAAFTRHPMLTCPFCCPLHMLATTLLFRRVANAVAPSVSEIDLILHLSLCSLTPFCRKFLYFLHCICGVLSTVQTVLAIARITSFCAAAQALQYDASSIELKGTLLCRHSWDNLYPCLTTCYLCLTQTFSFSVCLLSSVHQKKGNVWKGAPKGCAQVT
jgi:hypothetical protein